MISIGVSKRFNFANTLRSANLAESLDGLAIERSSNIKLILSSCQQITLIRTASFLHFEWLNISIHLINKSSTAFRKSQEFCHQKIGHILAYFKFRNCLYIDTSIYIYVSYFTLELELELLTKSTPTSLFIIEEASNLLPGAQIDFIEFKSNWSWWRNVNSNYQRWAQNPQVQASCREYVHLLLQCKEKEQHFRESLVQNRNLEKQTNYLSLTLLNFTSRTACHLRSLDISWNHVHQSSFKTICLTMRI